MEKDEISDIVKKVLEAQEKGKNETTKVEKKEEVVPATEEKSISEVEYENQRIEDIIDRKIDERISIEKENWKKENEDRTGRREASWSLVLGIVSIISSTSLIFAILLSIIFSSSNKLKKNWSPSSSGDKK